jgi:MFS family permease
MSVFHDGVVTIRGLTRALPGTPGERAGDRDGQATALVVVAVAQFLIALDYSIVYLALPGIARALHLSAGLAQWVVSSYAVFFAGFLVVGGRLADRFGPARMFVVAMALFGAASGAGAAAGDAALLLGARAAQGLGAALLQPSVLGLIGTVFPAGRQRTRALAVWAAVGAAGLGAGALFGGLLTAASWRLTLLVNVPPALACALVATGWTRTWPGMTGPARPVPLLAAVLGAGSVLALALGLTLGGSYGWRSWQALSCLAAALTLSAWFVRNEKTSDNALIEASLRRARSVRTGAAAAALYMASVGSEFYLLTLLLQTLRHYSPLRAGLAFLPLALMVTVGSVVTGRAARRLSPAVALTAGFVIALAGLTWIVVLLPDDFYPVGLLPGLLLSGFGHGAIYTATFTIGTGGVPDEYQGTAGALLTTAQYVAGAVTLAVLTLILARYRGYAGFTAAFLVIAAAAGAGALLRLRHRLRRRTRLRARHPQAPPGGRGRGAGEGGVGAQPADHPADGAGHGRAAVEPRPERPRPGRPASAREPNEPDRGGAFGAARFTTRWKPWRGSARPPRPTAGPCVSAIPRCGSCCRW